MATTGVPLLQLSTSARSLLSHDVSLGKDNALDQQIVDPAVGRAAELMARVRDLPDCPDAAKEKACLK